MLERLNLRFFECWVKARRYDDKKTFPFFSRDSFHVSMLISIPQIEVKRWLVGVEYK